MPTCLSNDCVRLSPQEVREVLGRDIGFWRWGDGKDIDDDKKRLLQEAGKGIVPAWAGNIFHLSSVEIHKSGAVSFHRPNGMVGEAQDSNS